MTTNWNGTQYNLYTDARKRPGLDLLAQIPQLPFKTIADIGCGTGFLTTELHKRFSESKLIAIDASQNMLAAARQLDPSIDWQQGDIEQLPFTKVDLLFSNAALHWLDDHDTLFTQLLSHINDAGFFAFQLPNNFSQPSHQLILKTIQEGPWKDRLLPQWRDTPTQSADFYYNLLSPSCQSLNLWQTTYFQVLEGDNPIAEWTRGTWLRRFMNLLDEKDQQEFFERYAREVEQAYPKRNDGKTLFPFTRISMIGQVK